MKNKLLTALFLLTSSHTVATSTGAAAASSSQPDTSTPSKVDFQFLMNGPFSIISTLSGKCVDADNWGKASDTKIHMYSCNKDLRQGTNQLFKIILAEDPHEFSIAFTHSNKCLTVEKDQNGSRLMQHTCGAKYATRQIFSLTRTAKLGSYHIQQNGKCLDVKNGNQANHADLQMWDCIQGNDNQNFSLKPALSFNDLPDELVGLILNQCSAGAQKTFRGLRRKCKELYSEMTEGRSVIIDMDTVSHLTQQGRPLSELYTLLNQAHVIEIRNATLANFPTLLPHMAQVRQLKVKFARSESGPNRLQIVQAIAQSPQMVNLTTLNLSSNLIDHAGATAIAQSQYMSKLTTLDLSWNEIGPAGATAIAQSPQMANLTTLDLEGNGIYDAGATAIAQSQYMSKLTTLNLSRNRIEDTGATAIAQSPQMANLTTLDLESNWINYAVRATIQKRFPFARF